MSHMSNQTSASEVDAVMKKYDRESNVRVWTGTPGVVVKVILAHFPFSVFMLHCLQPSLRKSVLQALWR